MLLAGPTNDPKFQESIRQTEVAIENAEFQRAEALLDSSLRSRPVEARRAYEEAQSLYEKHGDKAGLEGHFCSW